MSILLGLEYLGVHMKRWRKIPVLVLSAALAALAALVFVPRRYPVADWKPLAGTRYLELPDGMQLGYQHLVPDSARHTFPIVFLQGGPGGHISARTLEMLEPVIRAGFGVYAYDQCGSGASLRLSSIRGYTVARHIADLDAVIEMTGADRVILMGQSWGGILASLYAEAHPERVAGIILTCPGPLPQGNPGLRAAKVPDSLRLRAPQVTNREANARSANLRSRAGEWMALHFGAALMPDAEADAFQSARNLLLTKSTYCDTANAPREAMPGSGYYVQVMTMQSLGDVPDPRPVLRSLRVPVLILKGQCDNQAWGVTQEYAQVFSGSRLVVIPGAGHNIAAEQPEAFRREILSFLNSGVFDER